MIASTSGSSPPSIHAALIVVAVLDQEGRARRDAFHARELEVDAEGASHVSVPVGEQRYVDTEGARPRRMRPDRVARDRERPDTDFGEIVAPVTQEQDLVRSGRRPIPEVKGQQGEAGAEHLLQRAGLLPGSRPDLNVGDVVTGLEHALSLRHPPFDLRERRRPELLRDVGDRSDAPRRPPGRRPTDPLRASPREPAAVGGPRQATELADAAEHRAVPDHDVARGFPRPDRGPAQSARAEQRIDALQPDERSPAMRPLQDSDSVACDHEGPSCRRRTTRCGSRPPIGVGLATAGRTRPRSMTFTAPLGAR